MHSFSHWFIWKSLSGGQLTAFLDCFTLIKDRRNWTWGKQGGEGSEVLNALGGRAHNMRYSLPPKQDVHKEKLLRDILGILKVSVHDFLPHSSDMCQVTLVGFWISFTVTFTGKSVHERSSHDLATLLFSQEVSALICWMRKESIGKWRIKHTTKTRWVVAGFCGPTWKKPVYINIVKWCW